MNSDTNAQNLTGKVAIIAGLLALISLIIGLVGVNWDFEVFSDASSLISSGARAGNFIKWSYWLNMVGNYFLLMPLAIVLHQWFKTNYELASKILTASGLVYMLLGAAGSAILAATWPYLIEQYAQAAGPQQEILVLQFQLVNAIAEVGLHGVLQNFAGAIWFVGMGFLMQTKVGGLGILAIFIGIFLLLNTFGNMFNIEAFSLIGLTANILLGPIWSILIGVYLIKNANQSA